jgi:hypothetical protein
MGAKLVGISEQNEDGTWTKGAKVKVSEIKPSQVVSAYHGKPGCGCGCRGTYVRGLAHPTSGGKARVDAQDVTAALRLRRLQKAEAEHADGAWAVGIDVSGNPYVSFESAGSSPRVTTVYVSRECGEIELP